MPFRFAALLLLIAVPFYGQSPAELPSGSLKGALTEAQMQALQIELVKSRRNAEDALKDLLAIREQAARLEEEISRLRAENPLPAEPTQQERVLEIERDDLRSQQRGAEEKAQEAADRADLYQKTWDALQTLASAPPVREEPVVLPIKIAAEGALYSSALFDVLDHQGGRFAPVPEWVGKDKPQISGMFSNKLVFVVENTGKSLAFLKDTAEAEAFAQVSKLITAGMDQRMGLTKRELNDGGYEQAVVNVINSSSQSFFSGLVKEAEWWELRSYHHPDSDLKGARYYYTALYTIDRTRIDQYMKDIRAQMRTPLQARTPLDDNFQNAIKELNGDPLPAPEPVAEGGGQKENAPHINRLLEMLKTRESNENRPLSPQA